MSTPYPGVGLVIDKQCPWCLNKRILVKQGKWDVTLICTMNGDAPTKKLPFCGYTVTLRKDELTKEEKKEYGVRVPGKEKILE